jgi:hypothetical protein
MPNHRKIHVFLTLFLALALPNVFHTSGQVSDNIVDNANPNYLAIREYARIEWHGNTADLVTGGTRPLYMAAFAISTCLGISVSAEEPEYLYPGDLLDVTDPQWAITHPDRHSYAPTPGKIKLLFAVNNTGSPADIRTLLQDAAAQVNQQQPYSFEVKKSIEQNHTFYSFVPTRTHDQEGNLVNSTPYLERKITFTPHTDIVPGLFDVLGQSLHSTTGLSFHCCLNWMVERGPWHGPRIIYEAKDQPARKVLEDLIVRTGTDGF